MPESNNIEIQKDMMVETLNKNQGYFFRAGELIHKTRTEFQDLEVYDVPGYGRMLRLDGVFQTSYRDEFLYHEPLAHVPGITIDGPETALVIGGGDGGSIEELLKYRGLKKVVMVELDGPVIDASKKYLPEISNGAFESDRLELRVEDGIKYVKETNEKFDQVLLDLTDPFGPSIALYTDAFYKAVNNILTDRGAMSLHIESPITRPAVFARLVATLKSVFKHVNVMLNYVPMYGTLWSYAMVSQVHDATMIDEATIQERIKKHDLKDLQFYNEKTHHGLMALPNYVVDLLSQEAEIIDPETKLEIEEEVIRDYAIARLT